MNIEAMKLALETYKKIERHLTVAETRYWCDQYRLLFEQFIEQAEKQEPVAFLAEATRFKITLTKSDCKITGLPRELGGRWVALVAAENDSHLSLTTPPRKEWQGLTDEEVRMLPKGETFYDFARAIEAKLKAKNA